MAILQRSVVHPYSKKSLLISDTYQNIVNF